MLINYFEQLNLGVQGCTSSVVLESNGTRDIDKLAISKSLMPLYHKLGKFIETVDGFKTCASKIAILHVPSNFPIQGFDMTWTNRYASKLSKHLSTLSHFLGLEGILLCICLVSFCGALSSCAGVHEFKEDPAIGIMTKGINGLVDAIPISPLQTQT